MFIDLPNVGLIGLNYYCAGFVSGAFFVVFLFFHKW